MSTGKSITKSASVIGLATLISRFLGFIRDVVIARVFGILPLAEAFVVSFKIPNLLRDFLGEGATNAAIVPVFSEYALRHSKEEFWELANVVLNLLLIILGIVTILGITFAPLIVRIIAPGFIANPEKLAMTVRLTRILFPYILLISLAAYAMGILNSLKHFSLPAFAPCLLNISLIVFALIFGESMTTFSLGVMVGGVLQLLVQIPVLYRRGFRLKPFRHLYHPQAVVIGRLMLPRLLSTGIYQLNNFVDSIFGSLAFIVGEGGVAILYFSYRLIQFPLGIFANSLSQAILPTLSEQALEDTHTGLKKTLSFGLRATMLVMLPATLGLMVLAQPIIAGLFASKRFDAVAVKLTAQTLFFYSLGLFAYGAKKVIQAVFFALRDTITPTKIAFVSLVINIILNAILMFALKIAGLALATSMSGIVSFLLLFSILKKRLKDFDTKDIRNTFWRILVASLGMGGVCYIFKNLPLGIAVFFGILSYLVFCFLLRVKEIKDLFRWILRKN
ncbi:MAG: murein biosynthesis integral membrane protein MurJ [Candidatus Omnitrophica bacterium]|nr:murein biosynthesis integral membrane protein MurJ [Candidatus Omnitrophota bacterium]